STVVSSILRNGTNVLAVEVHNQATSSSDLSSIPFISFGIADNSVIWGAVPSWFHAPSTEYLHTNFHLDKNGETILLANASGTILDQKTFPALEVNNTSGRSPNGSSTWCVFATATPGVSNSSSTCYSAYATIPLFSLSTGFYTGMQSLTLTTAQSGGVIRYSKDGTDPTSSS